MRIKVTPPARGMTSNLGIDVNPVDASIDFGKSPGGPPHLPNRASPPTLTGGPYRRGDYTTVGPTTQGRIFHVGAARSSGGSRRTFAERGT